MRHVPVATFKDKVSEFIAAAEAGEEVIITRHGKVAARLLPPDDLKERSERARQAMARLKEMRDKMRAEGRTASIDEMIAWKNEGRK
ncbi:MAG TPA: type II toxin-antitoxin system prevent-host-death family antitoxin [Sphingomicrobium sp.]|jgi:prevent-host-death family protein|nr:type II toxin-antitoxin system prevent-host-death family antitoxin [Sphingomicrobium sp.]